MGTMLSQAGAVTCRSTSNMAPKEEALMRPLVLTGPIVPGGPPERHSPRSDPSGQPPKTSANASIIPDSWKGTIHIYFRQDGSFV